MITLRKHKKDKVLFLMISMESYEVSARGRQVNLLRAGCIIRTFVLIPFDKIQSHLDFSFL